MLTCAFFYNNYIQKIISLYQNWLSLTKRISYTYLVIPVGEEFDPFP